VRILRAAAAAALLVGCSTSPGPGEGAPAAPAPAAGPTTYLALGDSVAAGIGADVPDRGGYVPLLAGLLSDRLGCEDPAAAGCPVELRNLSVGGATTTTLLRNQLPAALEVLSEQEVRLVTVTIGGNDVFEPIVRACVAGPQRPACQAAVEDALRRVEEGVDRLLSELARAAGSTAVVALMAYYNPVPSCQLAPLADLAAQVLEGTDQQRGLNDVLRERAERNGAVVVETAEALQDAGQFVGGSDCLHPSAAGHASIARAFDTEVGSAVGR
jgi:lysophospholipase L1-like esterase